MAEDRIDYSDDGNLDDVVINDVEMFRLEYMADNSIWMMCYRRDKPDIRFSLSARGKITGFAEQQ